MILSNTLRPCAELLWFGTDEKSIELIKACEDGDLNAVQELLNDRETDPTINDNHALKMAFKNKHPEVILALLKNDEVYQSIEPFDVLMLASKEGYLDIVRYLITDKKIDLTDADEAIEEAIENNHLEIVQILFNDPRINKSDLNLPYFLVLATQNNRTDIVHFLIENEGANPEAENSEAIRWAYKVKNRDIIQLFVAVTEKNRQAITSTTNTPEAGEDVNKLASRIKKEKRSSSFMSKIKQALT